MLLFEKIKLRTEIKSAVEVAWNLTLETKVENLQFRETSNKKRKVPEKTYIDCKLNVCSCSLIISPGIVISRFPAYRIICPGVSYLSLYFVELKC